MSEPLGTEPTAPVAQATAERTSETHPTHIAHLVMGLAFLGLVALWAAVTFDWVDNDLLRWLIPVPWLVAGLGGLIAIVISRRKDRPA